MFGLDLSPALNVGQSAAPFRNKHFSTYSNPFFDQAQFFIPRNIKSVFKFGRWVYYAHEYAHAVLSKIPTYVVTDLIYNPAPGQDTTPMAREISVAAWKRVMEHEIKIRPLLQGTVKDWQVYGNAFVMMIAEKHRFLRCSGSCAQTWDPESLDIKWRGYNTGTKMPQHECKKDGVVDLQFEDPPNAAIKHVTALRLNPENIYIRYNPLNGESTYYYQIPPMVRDNIRKGDADYCRGLPQAFIQAAYDDKLLTLEKGWVYHFKSVGLAEEDMGWGKPPILPVLRSIYHMAVIRRAEEMLLMEHIVPLRIMFPQAANGMNPAQWIDYGLFTAQLQQWLQIWKTDQNAIPITNFPVGVANIGGDAKALLATPQLQEFYKLGIINGLGVPREFVEGGLSYSGSSMSLRMLQNQFVDIRIQLKELVDFISGFIRDAYGFAPISIEFTDLKMADDVAKNNQAIDLMGKSMISRKTVLNQLGYNYEDEREQIKLEIVNDNEIKKLEATAAAESQAETQQVMARAEARAQYENYKATQELQDRERQRHEMEMQVKRRSTLMSMPDENLIQRIQAGFASVSDIIYLVHQGRIPADLIDPLVEVVSQEQAQILASMGIDPEMLDQLPPELAVMVSNNIIPPRDLQKKLIETQQQAAAEAAQQGQPQQGQPQQGQPQGASADKGQQRVQGYAQELSKAGSPQERAMIESNIKAKDPQGLQAAEQLLQQQKQEAPLPEKLPPRRNNGQA